MKYLTLLALLTISSCISLNKIKTKEPEYYKTENLKDYSDLLKEKSISFRKQENSNPECHPQRQPWNSETAKKELEELKQEVFGDKNYSLDSLRSSNQIYDPKWLLNQLKISKMAMIEDKLASEATQ